MIDRDSIGRRRRPSQNTGLRPLYPPLPAGTESRSIRVAMSALGWARLERVVAVSVSPTRPRAVGTILEQALAPQADWQDWQIRKEKQLLDAS